jgi:hypothetical protein
VKSLKVLIINTHLTYPGWSEGKLNLRSMELAKAFFMERGHQVAERMSNNIARSNNRDRTRRCTRPPTASLVPRYASGGG